MRGRKINLVFLGEFISNCLKKNLKSSPQILLEAKSQISILDDQIKQIENLKIKRSNLLDVISKFENGIDKERDILVLSLFNITNIKLSNLICKSIKDVPIEIIFLKNNKYSDIEIMKAIKQLENCKVIYVRHKCIFRGENFNLYMERVLCND